MSRSSVGCVVLFLAGCRVEPVGSQEVPRLGERTRCLSPSADEVLREAGVLDAALAKSGGRPRDDDSSDDDSSDDDDDDSSGGEAEVPVYFHVITDSAGNDDVSDLVPAQMDLLNEAFDGLATFTLVDIDVTADDDWYTATLFSDAEWEMKETLR
ncbi:MAG: hypothetical protein ABMA64_00810, partial [Myxococcota bacterium]